MIKKSRLDLYLLKKGLCETRHKAQGLILAGKVRDINGKVFDKPGQQVLIGSEFLLIPHLCLYQGAAKNYWRHLKNLKLK